jgi:nucleoside-diphosphate-sugar epimerase
VVKVDPATGAELAGPVEPEELLVRNHRDDSAVRVAAEVLASRLVALTGNEALVKRGLKVAGRVGDWVGAAVGRLARGPDWERRAKELFGAAGDPMAFRFRRPTRLTGKEVEAHITELQKEARARLASRGEDPRLRVLLTGATGFLGQELLAQMAEDRRIAEVVALVRPRKLRDPRTRAVARVLSPRERGARLLRCLGVGAAAARKFRFVRGDIERPGLGIGAAERERLRRTLTHVVHCAASVSFDDTYESSFRANVFGCRNALEFSLDVQRTPGSRFVGHVAIETSYIHGRRRRALARESDLVFPRHYYNNFYELTKAMASLETERALMEEGLRVSQILPSIIVGRAGSGSNRGDAKVVNAPINAFGRAARALASAGGTWAERVRARLVGAIATTFPADPTAELNLVPVDRVARGILAALHTPEATGRRIHLATDSRIRAEQMARITREELGVDVRMADPALTRNLTLPLAKALLSALGEARLANALEKLGTVFGVYTEWGQPIHGVGNDVSILGLPARRPDATTGFRMLCRHNRYVQEFGRVRRPEEIARRERIWDEAVGEIEFETGREASSLAPEEFRRLLAARVDRRGFRPIVIHPHH